MRSVKLHYFWSRDRGNGQEEETHVHTYTWEGAREMMSGGNCSNFQFVSVRASLTSCGRSPSSTLEMVHGCRQLRDRRRVS